MPVLKAPAFFVSMSPMAQPMAVPALKMPARHGSIAPMPERRHV